MVGHRCVCTVVTVPGQWLTGHASRPINTTTIGEGNIVARKPWYVSTEQWERRGSAPAGQDAIATYEVQLGNTLRSLPAEDEKQTAMLIELIREVHAVKWILLWTMVIVPIIVLVLGILLIKAVQPPPVRSGLPGSTSQLFDLAFSPALGGHFGDVHAFASDGGVVHEVVDGLGGHDVAGA